MPPILKYSATIVASVTVSKMDRMDPTRRRMLAPNPVFMATFSANVTKRGRKVSVASSSCLRATEFPMNCDTAASGFPETTTMEAKEFPIRSASFLESWVNKVGRNFRFPVIFVPSNLVRRGKTISKRFTVSSRNPWGGTTIVDDIVIIVVEGCDTTKVESPVVCLFVFVLGKCVVLVLGCVSAFVESLGELVLVMTTDEAVVPAEGSGSKFIFVSVFDGDVVSVVLAFIFVFALGKVDDVVVPVEEADTNFVLVIDDDDVLLEGSDTVLALSFVFDVNVVVKVGCDSTFVTFSVVFVFVTPAVTRSE